MENAIYNPKDLPEDELPYIFGFNNGGEPGWYETQLIAEDDTDLGINEGSRPDRHETFQKHYLDEYRMDFEDLRTQPENETRKARGHKECRSIYNNY